MPRAISMDDPPPVPPVQPDLDDCCHSGCTPCVFDLYDEALERYRAALAEWKARHDKQAAPKRENAPPGVRRRPRESSTRRS